VKDRARYFPDKLHFFKICHKEGTKSSCNWMKWQFREAVVQIKAARTSFFLRIPFRVSNQGMVCWGPTALSDYFCVSKTERLANLRHTCRAYTL
jgi:hypothetical protein